MGSTGPRPTIYLLEQFPPAAVQHCQSLFNTVLSTDAEVKNWRENATAILVREVTISADDISQAKKLKAIGKQGVGIDIIDQDACAQRGIAILNTPGANAQSVAELVLSLTMAVARQLRTIVVNQAANLEVRKEHCFGTTLQGKTIGIVGMGNIGLAVGRMFRGAFNSPILAHDPFAPKDAWSDLYHTRVDEFADMLPHVDILTLHLPLTPKTRNFIAAPQIRKMKKNAILINAARGGIINEEDLINALNEGLLYGVGLDCHDEEPPTLGRYSKLWASGRVISTPHIGATTSETQIHTATTALNRVYEYLTKSESG
ncbi:D-isomer specific 2-hydroxyacid dehydrogenase [Aspergillus granulosus]|uniref:D-isomer specific 2-hydroxyacid dehydrogenase n=1 Tax=Aspergillus granulosus TaxID=176169 RepID=A0ABR4I080_9EURO